MRMNRRQGFAAFVLLGIGLAIAGTISLIDNVAPQTATGDLLAVLGSTGSFIIGATIATEIMRYEITQAKIDGARNVATVIVQATNHDRTTAASTEIG